MWSASLETDRLSSGRSLSMLAAPERERLRAFARRRDAQAFLGRRVFLRVVLAGYLGRDPSRLVFSSRCAGCGSAEHGKPYLAPPPAAPGLEFSASCSRGEALVGVSRSRPLGVDVERSDPELPLEALLAYASSADESRAMNGCPAAARASLFVLAWTLKEAYLKALGLGLSRDPADLSVLCRDGRPWLLRDSQAPNPSRDWRLAATSRGEHRLALAHLGDCSVRWLRARPLADSPW